VPKPLPGDENGRADMQFELGQFERRGVAVPHQIADQPAIGGNLLGAAPIGNAGALHDGSVVAHIVHDPDKAFVQHVDRRKHQFFDLRTGRAAGRHCGLPRFGDFLVLCIGQTGHGWLSGLDGTSRRGPHPASPVKCGSYDPGRPAGKDKRDLTRGEYWFFC
jgi:hypothetical protein